MSASFFDSHSHIQLCSGDFLHKLASFFSRCQSSSINFHISINGVSPDDWNKVQQAYNLYPHNIYPNFGIHPWYAASSTLASPDWKSRLNELLEQHPNSAVGEIGLDKTPKALEKASLAIQKDVFEYQVQLAVQFQRPMNIHCVRAYSDLLEILSRCCKSLHAPGIILHSYAGSADMIRKFSSLNCYFSFAGPIASATSRVIKVLARVPSERLLVETDAPDQFPSFNHFSQFWRNHENAQCGSNVEEFDNLREATKQLSSASLSTIMNEYEEQPMTPDGQRMKIENESSLIPFVIASIYQHLKTFNANADFKLSLEDLQQIVFENGRRVHSIPQQT